MTDMDRDDGYGYRFRYGFLDFPKWELENYIFPTLNLCLENIRAYFSRNITKVLFSFMAMLRFRENGIASTILSMSSKPGV